MTIGNKKRKRARAKRNWHVFESDDRDNGRYVLDEGNNLVADCFADTHMGFGLPDRPEYLRNARLIAKAPKLREFIALVARMKTEKEFGEDAPPSEDWIS